LFSKNKAVHFYVQTPENPTIIDYNSFFQAVPQLRQLVTSLSTKGPWFDPRLIHVESVVDKVTLDQVFLRMRRAFPVSIIPPVLH